MEAVLKRYNADVKTGKVEIEENDHVSQILPENTRIVKDNAGNFTVRIASAHKTQEIKIPWNSPEKKSDNGEESSKKEEGKEGRGTITVQNGEFAAFLADVNLYLTSAANFSANED